MSLEESFDRLAKAMDKYADVIERFGLKIESDAKAASGKTADAEGEKPVVDKPKAGRPAGTKAKPKPVESEEEEDDNDGLDDPEDEDETTLTRDQVKEKLKEVIEATDDRKAASSIFKGLGYASVADIAEKDFQKVYDLAVKAIKKAS